MRRAGGASPQSDRDCSVGGEAEASLRPRRRDYSGSNQHGGIRPWDFYSCCLALAGRHRCKHLSASNPVPVLKIARRVAVPGTSAREGRDGRLRDTARSPKRCRGCSRPHCYSSSQKATVCSRSGLSASTDRLLAGCRGAAVERDRRPPGRPSGRNVPGPRRLCSGKGLS